MNKVSDSADVVSKVIVEIEEISLSIISNRIIGLTEDGNLYAVNRQLVRQRIEQLMNLVLLAIDCRTVEIIKQDGMGS